jgi:hypothetical protein
MPKNNLEIRLLSDNQIIDISRVKSFALAEKRSDAILDEIWYFAAREWQN